MVLAVGLERPDEWEDCWEEMGRGRSVVAEVRLVTVDLDREWPMSRLEDVVGGGPPDDLGRPVVVLAVRAIVDVPPVVVEDGGWRVEAALPRALVAPFPSVVNGGLL